ncbi:MAG: hypothetical protein LBE85_07430 [Candidatus Accumulibacter sp.]|jgi:hypothetical protein|nr:hypothetical protein [Accumulibacter sp.]
MKANPLKLTTAILLVFAFVATAQATDTVQTETIQNKFNVINLKKETFGAEVNKCIPAISVDSPLLKDSIKDFPSNAITTYRSSGVASVFVAHRTTGLCLKLSPGKHPIFAAEAFIETVNPVGVPQNVVDDWYKRIAATIAQKGSAKIAYVFDNGNAFFVNYSVESDSPCQLMYSLQFKEAGTWESEKLDSKFTHASLSNISETKRNKQSIKHHPLLHRGS